MDDRYWKQSNANPERRRKRLERMIPRNRSGCWEWTGAKLTNGYGVMRAGQGKGSNARWYVHRVAYELWVGPIPEGLQVDHLCRNRACFNPAHLEAVTARVNLIRGEGVAGRARREMCEKGLHLKTPENLMVSRDGQRRCRPCNYEWQRQRRARRREESAA